MGFPPETRTTGRSCYLVCFVYFVDRFYATKKRSTKYTNYTKRVEFNF